VVDAYIERYDIEVYLNFDHGKAVTELEQAIELGYDLVHFDGGKLPFEKNLSETEDIVKKAHRHGMMVEGEIDHITGTSTVHRTTSVEIQKKGTYTDPKLAQRFVAETGIDTLAIFIGNVHGIYSTPPKLDFERLDELKSVASCYLALHGGSGIRDTDIMTAIEHGINKINVNSELRLAFIETLRKAIKDPKEIASYKFFPPVINAVQKVVEAKIKLFGSAGKIKRNWTKRTI
jgi:ketose-bisphosphate aldolase